MVGSFHGTVDFDPNEGTQNLVSWGGEDIYIQKLDSLGNLIWVKQIGGSYDDVAIGICVDSDENVYVTGNYRGAIDFDPSDDIFIMSARPDAGDEMYILKLDSEGSFVWAKEFDGTGRSESYAITCDRNDNILTVGDFYGSIDFDPGEGEYFMTPHLASLFISKISADGHFVWAKQFSGYDYYYFISSVATDSEGSIYTTGFFNDTMDFDPGVDEFELISTAESFDIFICKLDMDGDFKWAHAFGDDGYDIGYDLAIDHEDNVYTTGLFRGVVDFNPDPDLVRDMWSSGYEDIFVQKLTKEGEFLWSKRMGGWYHDYGWEITTDHLGNVYSAGVFDGEADFDPSADTASLSSARYQDMYIHALDKEGNFLWVKQVAGDESEYPLDIFVDDFANLYTLGHFWDTVDFCPDTSGCILYSKGHSDIFVHKLSLSIPLKQNQTDTLNDSIQVFKIFPNPTSGNLTIELEREYEDIEVNIFDAQGKWVYSEEYQNTDEIKINLNISAGVYLIEVETIAGVSVDRVVIR